jgi:phosphate transport system substrate-binding protein
MLTRPEMKAFVDFYILNGAQLATEVGYVRLPEAEYQANRELVNGTR